MAKLSRQQWFDARQLWEQDESLSLRGLADMLGLNQSGVAKRAKCEGWTKVDGLEKVDTSKVDSPKIVVKIASKTKPPKAKKTKLPKLRNPSNLKILAAGYAVPETGRSTKYSTDYDDLVFNLSLLGKTTKQIAELIGVDESTLYDWVKNYPKFAKSLKEGRDVADSQIARSLFERAKGYEHESEKIFNNNGAIIRVTTTEKFPPETGAIKLWLINRQPQLWRDRIEVENSNKFDPETLDLIKNEYISRLQAAMERQNAIYKERGIIDVEFKLDDVQPDI